MSALERLKKGRRFPHKRLAAASCSHVLNDEYMERFNAQLDTSIQCRVEVHATASAGPTFHAPPASQDNQRPAQPCAQPCSAWWRGPAEEAGMPIPLATANIFCASMDWERGEAVFGSADHALYTVDLRQRKKARTLYSKGYGHSEWVTAVQHLPGGSIVSGSMDSKLCLWDRSRTRCKDLVAHGGSISQVELVQSGAAFLSASYDKTLILWDAGSGRQLQRLTAHRAPLLQLCTAGGAAASGDRNGELVVWDLGAGRAERSMPLAHQGHITAMAWGAQGSSSMGGGCEESDTATSQTLLLSGGQDGWLWAWDCRSNLPAAQLVAHAGSSGKGAVSNLVQSVADSLVITAGADGTVKAFDGRRGLQQVWAVQLQDFPYSMTATGGLVLVGCGDGSLSVINGANGKVQYALGASTAAVQTIHAASQQLVVGGDDGTVLIYDFVT